MKQLDLLEKIAIIFVISILLLLFVGVFLKVREQIAHKKYLKDHGCQVYFQAKTGRRIWNGKTSHDEVIILYECADGYRTEVY